MVHFLLRNSKEKVSLLMNIFEVDKVNVGGIPTACIDRKELANLIGEHCVNNKNEEIKKSIVIFSNNGHAISIANTSSEAMKLLLQADLIHADGQSVVTFSKWVKGRNIPERTATTDMIHDIPNYFESNINHFLLGCENDIVENACKLMSKRYKNFKISGFNDGFFSIEEEDEIIDKINSSRVDVLWVGLGKPKEQEFCIRNKEKLNVSVIITCGGCYNYITNDYPRAPVWMQKIGFEWLHRMSTNPRKLFYRYLTTNPHAVYCVIKNELFL
jgi:exopolysaccharide biosynthesis WecB/TagA/CpsF family protein